MGYNSNKLFIMPGGIVGTMIGMALGCSYPVWIIMLFPLFSVGYWLNKKSSSSHIAVI